MRITTKMMTQSLITNVNNNLQKLQEYENQLSSGVKVDKASDDPIAAAKILNAKSELKSQEQYSTNMDYASSYLDTVSDALSSVYDVLESARSTAVSGSTETTSTTSLEALGAQINSLVEEMVQLANTDYNGSYVFGGGATGSAPFTMTQDTDGTVTGVQFISSSYNTSDLEETYSQKIEIASGVTMDLAAGETTFHTDDSGNTSLNAMFSTLIQLATDLNNGDTDAVSSAISSIDGLIDNVTNEQAVVGAKANRIEAAQSRATAYTTNLTTLISSLQSTNIAETSTKYSSAQTTYEAALSVGAKIIQPSLLDFLS